MLLPALIAAAVGPAAEHGEHAEEAGAAGLPQLDFATWPGQIFWLVVSFGVLYLLLSRWLLPRIGAVIEDRRDRIADDIDAAGQLQRQSEEARARHERALADARAKAHAIAGETRAKLGAEIAEETRMSEAAFARKAAEAEARIKATADAAIANVKAVAGEAAAALVTKLAGAAPRPDAVAKALDAAERSRR